MKKILLEGFKTCVLRGKKDVELNFDYSYMPNMNGTIDTIDTITWMVWSYF